MHLFGTHDQYDHVTTHVRAVILGAPEVGKTSLVQQTISQTFTETYKETVEDTYFCKGDKFLLEITDTSGSFNFPEMTKLAIQDGDVFVLVFSVTDWTTFDRIAQIKKQITDIRGEDAPIIVVGNKADSTEREIPMATADSIACIEWGCRYHDVSSKDYEATCDVFNDVLKSFPSLYGERVDSDAAVKHINVPSRQRKQRNRSSKLRSSFRSFFKKLH